MKIRSSAFRHGGKIPSIYTCDGKSVNPPLVFEDVPKNAVTLALIVDDPDAPGTFYHWLVWNIDSSVPGIEENAPSLSANFGKNSLGNQAYTGPCPPSGEHRYFFRLYALDKRLNNLNEVTTTHVELMEEIEKNLIEKAELLGVYSKKTK